MRTKDMKPKKMIKCGNPLCGKPVPITNIHRIIPYFSAILKEVKNEQGDLFMTPAIRTAREAYVCHNCFITFKSMVSMLDEKGEEKEGEDNEHRAETEAPENTS